MIDPQEMLRIRWNANLRRGADGAPLVNPLFVAEHGPGIQIADVRQRENATGVLGHIPGSVFLDEEQLLQHAGDMDAPLVLVSATGAAAADVARRLEDQGVRNIAAMTGGIAEWRALGLSTSRDSAGVQEQLHSTSDDGPESGPITRERVLNHVGDARSVRWIKLASIFAHGRVSCIDGRDERGVIGAPGGDAGEFLLLLGAIEKATGQELDDETVAGGLLARLDTFGHFCMHTDVHAFETFASALSADQRLEAAVANLEQPEEWAEFLHQSAPELRDALLEHLVDPAHIGCGHIRLMLQHSDEYGIRRDLVLSFLRAFYRLWWEGAPELQLTTLPGGHGECAVVNARLSEEVWSLTRVPLVSPECGGQQMFVNHPDISNFLRQATVKSLVSGDGPLSMDPALQDKLQATVDELAAQQFGVTAGYLANGLPIFEVVFGKDGSIDVQGDSA